jgi:copper chaperone CopZ
MRKFWLSSLMLTAALGCGQNSPSPVASDSPAVAPVDEALPEGVVLVKLKLPEMTWGGCAAAVRSDLANVEGVSDVQTDIKKQSCQFKLANKDLDLKAKLDELAQGNEHLKGFEIVEN